MLYSPRSISSDVSTILRETKSVIQNQKSFQTFMSSSRHFPSSFLFPSLFHHPSPSPFSSYTKYINTNIKRPQLINNIETPRHRIPIRTDDYSNPMTFYSTRKPSSSNMQTFVTSTKYRTLSNREHKRRRKIALKGNIRNYEMFMNEKYKELVYEENRIYNRDEEIGKLILNKIEYFTKNENENDTVSLTENICTSNMEIMLKLTSLKITFSEIDENGNKINKSPFYYFNLPFHLLPIFYYKGIENFKLILSKVLVFSNDYNRMTLNESILYEFLQNQAKPKYHADNINKENDFIKFDLSLNPMSLINELTHKKHHKTNLTDRNSEMSFPAHNVKTIHIYNKMNSQKNLLAHGYKIIFIWTTPLRQFQVLIETPKVFMIEKKSQITIEQYIDGYLLFYLYENMFQNWDFYILNYLFSFKKCRSIFDNIHSKSNNKTNYAKSKYEFVSPFIITPQEQMKHSVYDYINTNDKRENTYNYLTSLNLKVSLLKNESTYNDYNYEYIIHFNFQQAKKIMEGLSFFPSEKIAQYLFKFTVIKGKELSFNYKLFDSITENEWKGLLKNILKFSIFYKRKSVFNNENFSNVMNNEIAIRKKSKLQEIFCDTSSFHKQIVDVVEPNIVENYLNEEGEFEQMKTRSYFNLFKNELVKKDINAWPALCNKILKEEEKVISIRTIKRKPQTVHVHNYFKSTFFEPKRSVHKKTVRKHKLDLHCI